MSIPCETLLVNSVPEKDKYNEDYSHIQMARQGRNLENNSEIFKYAA